MNAGSVGFVLELPPFAGVDAETLGALAGTLADAAPERSTVQIIHWASPRFGAALDAWAAPRERAGGVQAAMAVRRRGVLGHAGWRALHRGRPAVHARRLPGVRGRGARQVPRGPRRRPRSQGFRRALEGTLASAGAAARRLAPDALLSLAAELTAPDTGGADDGGLGRPPRRWAPRDALHLQCAAPGRALTVAPTGLAFHPGSSSRFPRRRGHRGAGADRGHVPRGVAGLARQRAHRRLPPRLPPAGRAGADLPHRRDRRGGRRRAGVPEVRPRHAAGRHRHRALPAGASGEGARLAVRDRAPERRRAPGARVLLRRGLRPARDAGRGRAGGARPLPRPGLADAGRALRAAPGLARVPADGGRRAGSTRTWRAWAG